MTDAPATDGIPSATESASPAAPPRSSSASSASVTSASVTSASVAPRRVLFVHAHPDDEAITTGITLAAYASRPDTHVTLVTCTLGELGEVLVPELLQLRSDLGDQLGGYRIAELERACAALGVADHRFLGGAGRFRDSGMMGTAGNDDPRCLWQTDLTEATVELVRVVREVRPQVLVSYDANGDYGHPDHIRAHQITAAAFTAAADPGFAPEAGQPWAPSKLYETATPKSFIQRGVERFADDENSPFHGATSADDIQIGVPDEQITTRIDAPEFLEAKLAAMRAHRTQIAVDGFFFALADGAGREAFGIDHYVLSRSIRPSPSPSPSPTVGEDGGNGQETDLFAGLELPGL